MKNIIDAKRSSLFVNLSYTSDSSEIDSDNSDKENRLEENQLCKKNTQLSPISRKHCNNGIQDDNINTSLRVNTSIISNDERSSEIINNCSVRLTRLLTSRTNDLSKKQDTILLEDSVIVTPIKNGKEQKTVINESIDIKIDNKNLENSKMKIQRPGRRLQPIRRNSQPVSLSPTERSLIAFTPVRKVIKKRLKKFDTKSQKQESSKNNYKQNISLEKQVTKSSKQFTDDDEFMKSSSKKNKKQKKLKKLCNQEVNKIAEAHRLIGLNIMRNNLEEINKNIEEGDSYSEFQLCKENNKCKTSHKSSKMVIVTTGLSLSDKNLIKHVIMALGKAKMESHVSKRTTHVVSTGVRTLNLLHAIIKGCWIVSMEWALKSLESNTWLNPENYEMNHYSKAVLENRRDRQLFGSSYIPDLFTACGYIYVEHKTIPPSDDIKSLIKAAGGWITNDSNNAKIIIGKTGLKETWVLDSITTGELQSVIQYQTN